jgi:hypothetical protein
MPMYADLVRRAVVARELAEGLSMESRQLGGLSRTLRAVRAGRVMLLRCAWCERFEIDGEWLRLDAVGAGGLRVTTSLLEHASHGICPDCFDGEMERFEESALGSGPRHSGARCVRPEWTGFADHNFIPAEPVSDQPVPGVRVAHIGWQARRR